VGEELVKHRDLLHDVVANLGDLGEEEEGEEASYTAEAGSERAVLCCDVEGNAVVVLRDGVLRTKGTSVSFVRAAHADGSRRLCMVGER